MSDNVAGKRITLAGVDKPNILFPRPNFALLRPTSPRKRLWQGAAALLIVLVSFTVGNFCLAPNKAVASRDTGHDFLAFYTAGTLARLQQFDLLYDLEAVREIE